MYEIESGLFQGGRPGTQPHNAKLDPSVTAIVNLEAEEDVPVLFCADRHKTMHCQVMLPIYDADYPGHDWLSMAVGIVESLRAGGKIVYIHCRAGVSRSVMLTAAVMMKKHNLNVDGAMEWIAKSNPKLNANPSFMRGLKEWHSRGYR